MRSPTINPQDTGNDDYGDLRLQPGSPAIDAGDNSRLPEGFTTDLDGEQRIQDGNGDGSKIVDMGSYEYPGLTKPPIFRGDMNCDGIVDFDDLDAFVLALTSQNDYELKQPNCNYLDADMNQDGSVDFNDIDGFITCLTSGACR